MSQLVRIGKRFSSKILENGCFSDDDDIKSFLNENANFVRSILDDVIASTGSSVKAYVRLVTKSGRRGQTEGFRATSSNYQFYVVQVTEQIIAQFENFNREGSGWQLDSVESATIHVVSYRPLAGSSFPELPTFIKNKKCCVNVKNYDDKCFLWSALAFLNHLPEIYYNERRTLRL